MSLVKLIREETRKDLVEKLDKYGKCALIRCTGFGKTWLLSEMTKTYKKVLYLYPSEVIKNTVKTVVNRVDVESENRLKARLKKEDNNLDFNNIKFITYMKLIRLTEEELKALADFDLIIFDECHRIGAKNTKDSVTKLFEVCKKSHFVGATATPERSDTFDVVETFFDNIVVFPYTLHDAFMDGIIKKPYYCYCTYDVETDLKQTALLAGQDINDIKVKEVLDSRLIEISKIYNMPSIIRTVVTKYAKDKTYLKFIVFFDGFTQLDSKGGDVIQWFEEAFKGYTVDTLTISSRTKTENDNVNLLDTLVRKDKHIDLIFCVDMLNMGYHVSDLTGIVMYRGTSSSIIYAQQLGRALSTGDNEACIVFDVVDNLHRKAFFELKDKNGVLRNLRKTTSNMNGTAFESNLVLTEQDKIELLQEYIARGKKDVTTRDWVKSCNDIYEEDLVAVGNEATYRELLAKLVVESIVQRCKRALISHFNVWTELCFDKEYPMNASTLVSENLDLPLKIYADWQNISLKDIVDNVLSDRNWHKNLIDGLYRKELGITLS